MLRVAMVCLPAIQAGMERRAAQGNIEVQHSSTKKPVQHTKDKIKPCSNKECSYYIYSGDLEGSNCLRWCWVDLEGCLDYRA